MLFFNILDIDECAQNPCHFNATCTDTVGSYECHCDPGFSGNGKNCSSKFEMKRCSEPLGHIEFIYMYIFHFLDINECLTISCHPNATCVDSVGSYSCRCNLGFTGNGSACESKVKSIYYSKVLPALNNTFT